MRRRELSAMLVASSAGIGSIADSKMPSGNAGLNVRYPTTAGEEMAGIVPTSYDVPAPYPERYGAVGDGATNDQVAIEKCISANNCIFMSARKTYLINGLTINCPYSSIQGLEGSGFIIANAAGNFGLRFVSKRGNKTHFNTGFVGRDFKITCESGAAKIVGIIADNAEIVLLENVDIVLARNAYQGSAAGDGSIAFYGYFQQDGVFVKCSFTGGGGRFGDGVHLTGNLSRNETPNNNYFLGCRAQTCGGYGVRVRLGDGTIWRGGKIQANAGGGWIEGDDGLGSGPSNTVIADVGFEANHNCDLSLSICGRTRVHDNTFQSTAAMYHICETLYSYQGIFQRNTSTSGKPVRFSGRGTDNVWDYNNGFGKIIAAESTFSIETYQIVTLKFEDTITTDCSKGYHFVIPVTSKASFLIANPANPKLGQLYTWEIINNSGVAMGCTKFGNEFLTEGPFVAPANGKRRTITFRRTNSGYVEITRNATDVG